VRGTGFADNYRAEVIAREAGARFVTPDLYWIFLAFSKASSIVPTM
jgi:hypothetical protein